MLSEPANREIRVFLSSTFRDMEAERNHLMKQVFPKVRAACQARRVGFTEIDLRWGVTEEEAKSGAVVEICLKEIDRCRDFPPFFVGFLGERYGWIPREEELAAYWQRHTDSPYANPIREAIRRGISVTELEMELAVLEDGAAEKIAGHALFLLRAQTLTDSLYERDCGTPPNPQDPRYYDPASGRLDALKARIRRTSFLGVDGYTRVEQFGQAVEDYLLTQLEHYFPEAEVPTPLQRMQEAHAAFGFHRLQNFLPRPDVRAQLLDAIERRIAAPALGPILLAGPSGQGKSVLLADLARHLETEPDLGKPGVHWRVIAHYVGADEHTSLDGWIKRILDTLHPEIEDLTGPVPERPKERQEVLSSWLAYAARRSEQRSQAPDTPVRFALILDALDQLLDGGKDLDPLTPATLGPDAVLIVSAADATPARASAAGFETVVVPPLTDALKTTLIQDTLQRYRKTLPADLALRLASAPQAGSPLYLTLALEELRLDARHESLGDLLGDILLSPDAPHLFLHRFLLDEDYGRPEAPTLAATFMAQLGAARNGLTENELADLLALPGDPVSEETGKPRLPQVYLSRLLTAFQPFLLNKQGNRAPMHRLFGEAALEYCGTAPVREYLYRYFKRGYGQGEQLFNQKAAAEALYQITQLANLRHDNQTNARKLLVEDLGLLYVPTNLCRAERDVTLTALTTLDDKEKAVLVSYWNKEIDGFAGKVAAAVGKEICNFTAWMRTAAYDGYRLPRILLEKLLERQETTLQYDHSCLADTLNLIALLQQDMADYNQARLILERALAIQEKALGPEHSDTALILNNLASYLNETGNLEDYAAARLLLYRALSIYENIFGLNHTEAADTLTNLAVNYHLSGDPEDFKTARSFFERALGIWEKGRGSEHPDTAKGLNNLAEYLRSTGNLEDRATARQLHERSLAIREKILGYEHPDTAVSLNNLFCLLQSNDDLKDCEAARPICERALAIRIKTLGYEHPHTASSFNNLAYYLERTGAPQDFADARVNYEHALAIEEKVYGSMHPSTAIAAGNLAGYLQSTGRPEDFTAARPLLERGLAIVEKSLGPDHPDTTSALNNLAGYLDSTGDPADFAAARPLYERALAIAEKAQGPEHPDTALYLKNLASYLDSTGDPADFAAARPLYMRALAIQEKALGPENPGTALYLNNLACYLKSTGDPADFAVARPLLERALAIQEKALGPEHPDTAGSRITLAGFLESTGDPADFAAARPLYERALVIREKALGPEHQDTAQSLNNLAGYLDSTGEPADFAAARPLYERALAILEKALGPGHPDTFKPLTNLAVYLKSTGDPADFATVRTLLERALAISEKVLGPEDPATALVLNSLAGYLKSTGDPADFASVQPFLERALAIREKALGPEHPDTAESLNSLAFYLQFTGDPADFRTAQPLFERSLAIREKALGPEHPDTAQSLNNLAGYLDSTGDPADFVAARPLYERALAIWEKALGSEHPDTARALNNLAGYLYSTGAPADVAAVRPLLERALAIREKAQGPEHPDTVQSRKNLADYLRSTSDSHVLATRKRRGESTVPTSKEIPFRLTETLKQWLKEQAWEEQPEIDEENQTSSTSFGFSAGDFSLNCWFDVSERTEVFRLFMYFLDTKVPEKKLEEVRKFVAAVSVRMMLGNLQLLREKRVIRYYNAIDVEDAAFEPQHISNLLSAGVRTMEEWLPKYMGICFGDKTADEVLAED